MPWQSNVFRKLKMSNEISIRITLCGANEGHVICTAKNRWNILSGLVEAKEPSLSSNFPIPFCVYF